MNFKGIQVLDAFGNLNSRSRFPSSYGRCKNNVLRQICRGNDGRASSVVTPLHGHSTGLKGRSWAARATAVWSYEHRDGAGFSFRGSILARALPPASLCTHPITPCTSTSSSPQNPWPSEPGRDVTCCLSLLWHWSRQPSSVKHQQGAVPFGGKLGRPSKEPLTLAKQTKQRCSHSGVWRQHGLGHGHTKLHFQGVILQAGRWVYISLQIHRERKGDGKINSVYDLKESSGLAPHPNTAVPQPNLMDDQCTLRHLLCWRPTAFPCNLLPRLTIQKLLFQFSLAIAYQGSLPSYSKWAQKTHFPSFLVFKDDPLVPPAALSTDWAAKPIPLSSQVAFSRLPDWKFSCLLNHPHPSHSFLVAWSPQVETAPGETFPEPGTVGLLCIIWRLRSSSSTVQYVHISICTLAFSTTYTVTSCLVSGPPCPLWEAAPWLLFPAIPSAPLASRHMFMPWTASG